MPCYNPQIAWRAKTGPNPSGKIPLVFQERKADLEIPSIRVSCGRCDGCKLERSRQWAVRMVHESKMHQNNSFITLTYADDNLQWGLNRPSLYPRHLTLFFKNLRKELAKNGIYIRYFACGEYGDTTNRPHYHACVFGYDFPDKTPYSKSMGNVLYSSRMLDNIWRHGHCIVGDFTFETAAYTARYIMKKRLGHSSQYYEDEAIEPEFVRMSRRPGIGSAFFDKYKNDMFPSDKMVIRNGVVTKPPKYYTNKIETIDPEMYTNIKESRMSDALLNGSESRYKRLLQRETVKKAQLKILKRDKI